MRLVGAAALLGLALVMVGTANASGFSPLIGTRLISAEGGTADNAGELGTFGLSGLINFNNSGGASWLNVTLTYQDSYFAANSAEDGFYCVLSTPSDVAYTLNTNGVGTLTLTVHGSDVSGTDTCTQTFNGGDLQERHSNSNNSIVFNLYVLGSLIATDARITATTSNLVDYSYDTIQTTTLTGSITH